MENTNHWRYNQVCKESPCPPPSADDYNRADADSLKTFNSRADAYCIGGSGCANGQTCKKVVTNLSQSSTLHDSIVGEERYCYIDVKTSGKVACTCQ